jgi:ketose-bisphosphate aldolase
MIANAKDMLIKATEGKYSVGAFNITSLVQMRAFIAIASETKSALIIQTSVTPAKFFTPEVLAAAFRVLAEKSPYPVCLHLDHCTEVDFCKRCADAGYTNIMIDASKHPFDENLKMTKEVADYCHAKGDITVEGELGTVVGVEDNMKTGAGEGALCDPDKAEGFVTKTGIDLFAPAIGTAHGVYKDEPKLDFKLLETIFAMFNSKKASIPLVIHGGTGLPEDTVKKLVALGGAKFNVSTEFKHVLIDATNEYVSAHAKEYDPGKIDKAVLEATKKAAAHWMNLLGSPNRY